MNVIDRRLALTFDDGPNDIYTPRLLDILDKHEVKATFFLIGRHVLDHPDVVRKIYSAGHVVGNHTLDHVHPRSLWQRSQSPVDYYLQVKKQLTECKKAIEDVLGCCSSPFFRPPYGEIDKIMMDEATSLFLITFNWTIADSREWALSRPVIAQEMSQKISEQVDSKMQDEIILLHDGSPPLERPTKDRTESVKTAELLIENYSKKGYKFVALPELIVRQFENQSHINSSVQHLP